VSAATFYADMAATALSLLTDFGKTITLTRTTGTTYDPVTGATVAGTDASVTTTGLIKPYPDKLIDGTRIQSGDRELVLSNEQTPTMDDKPNIDGQQWSIINIKTVKPDGATPVVYFAQVRAV